METKILPIKQGQNLEQALDEAGYENIPSNVVLDKILPGLGATHSEIKAKRHSVIIEPSLPVIIGKVIKHADIYLFGVCQGVYTEDVEKFLKNSPAEYNKLITTPESYCKIQKAAQNLGIDLHADYFCLFDECERLTQDRRFRKKITNPVKDFFEYKDKAFVSATPLDIHHRLIEEQNFIRLVVEPDFNYQKNITVIATTNVVRVLKEKLEELKDSPCVCIFFNSTNGINKLVNNIPAITADYKIFCSEKSKSKLVNTGFKRVYSELDLPFAKYDLLTSRFNSAVDIDLSILPDIIMYTDLDEAEYTMIDPFSEAIQIQGRFRNKFENGRTYNSLTHITNTNKKLNVKTIEQIDREVEFFRLHNDFLENQKKNADNVLKEAISGEIDKTKYTELSDDDGILDEFAVNNLYNEERVKGYYLTPESLEAAYRSNSKMFNLNFQVDRRINLEQEKLKIKRAKSLSQKIYDLVQLLKEQDSLLVRNVITSELFQEAPIILQAFDKLGAVYIESVNCKFKVINEALTKRLIDEKRFSHAILEEIYNTFHVGEKQSKAYFQKKTQEIYSKFLINYRVKQKTIVEYFDAAPDNSVSPAAYVLKKWNPKPYKNQEATTI
jgi:hypothetical protein